MISQFLKKLLSGWIVETVARRGVMLKGMAVKFVSEPVESSLSVWQPHFIVAPWLE